MILHFIGQKRFQRLLILHHNIDHLFIAQKLLYLSVGEILWKCHLRRNRIFRSKNLNHIPVQNI